MLVSKKIKKNFCKIFCNENLLDQNQNHRKTKIKLRKRTNTSQYNENTLTIERKKTGVCQNKRKIWKFKTWKNLRKNHSTHAHILRKKAFREEYTRYVTSGYNAPWHSRENNLLLPTSEPNNNILKLQNQKDSLYILQARM